MEFEIVPGGDHRDCPEVQIRWCQVEKDFHDIHYNVWLLKLTWDLFMRDHLRSCRRFT